MSFRHLGFALVAVFVASACTKSATDAPAAVSIPDKPVLNQPQSQALNLDEYNTFRTFISNEEPLPEFSPQDYVFQTLPESGLSQDQQSLLSRIRLKCQNPHEEKDPDTSNIGVGSVLVTTRSKTSSGSADCPLAYSYAESLTMTVVAGSQQQVVLTGNAAVKESLSLTDWNVASIIGTNQTSNDANGSVAYVLNQKEERMRISITSGHQIVSAYANINQPGHSEELNADNITITNMGDGSRVRMVALNVIMNVPNLPKQVVVSIAGTVTVVQNAPVITPTEFYVNHSTVPVMDQNSLLNSKVMKSILKKIVDDSQALHVKTVAKAKAALRK